MFWPSRKKFVNPNIR